MDRNLQRNHTNFNHSELWARSNPLLLLNIHWGQMKMTMKTKAPSTAKLNIVENSVIYNEDQCTALDRETICRKKIWPVLTIHWGQIKIPMKTKAPSTANLNIVEIQYCTMRINTLLLVEK